MKKGDFKNSTIRFVRQELDFLKDGFAEAYPGVSLRFSAIRVFLDNNEQLFVHFDTTSRILSQEIGFINTVRNCLSSSFMDFESEKSSIICDFATRRISIKFDMVDYFASELPF